jgi:hypothetical protein
MQWKIVTNNANGLARFLDKIFGGEFRIRQ